MLGIDWFNRDDDGECWAPRFTVWYPAMSTGDVILTEDDTTQTFIILLESDVDGTSGIQLEG